MVSPMKSPNMMSTMGRMPVIAPPTPRPVIPASEIGESMTRPGPNSSTRRDKHLEGCSCLSHVFPDDKHSWIMTHLLGNSLANGLSKGDLAYVLAFALTRYCTKHRH